ncbi:hypothetical protein GGTG_01520 [Gaeumannomyces tritici R3-111a-1]|uniref:Uncharacterized protein n=1 Tax=Gaeumannomyces tritici (strain R3-111a-1) TaxID=644352 RepID=J3NJT9_GAET3|nr:hypothetical protein GGTG_01520 [Gaeumannomyces tritici R3-111a-1]EJT81542.1 hypothetical protein GGTG_01520 [Gaeumannomyces tritici R3-111a-1]
MHTRQERVWTWRGGKIGQKTKLSSVVSSGKGGTAVPSRREHASQVLGGAARRDGQSRDVADSTPFFDVGTIK